MPGAVVIIDTLRSAHSRDENATQFMQEVMDAAKRLRLFGATVILLHHSPKGNDAKYIGSVAILNQSDHVIALYPSKQGSDTEKDDDDPNDTESKAYCFRTVQKTRFDHFKIWVTFNSEKCLFDLAPDPDDDKLLDLHRILTLLVEKEVATQTAIIELAKEDGITRNKCRSLLKTGEGKYWVSQVDNSRKRATIYTPLPLSDNKDITVTSSSTSSPMDIELSSCSDSIQTTELQH